MESIINTVSFDYDGCLDSSPVIRELAMMYKSFGKKVYILTNRTPHSYRNHDLYALAQKLGINESNILFAWDTEKYLIISEKKIDVHYDNDTHEIHKINMNCGPQAGVLIHYQYTSNDIHDDY